MRYKYLFSLIIALLILSSCSVIDNFVTQPSDTDPIEKKGFPETQEKDRPNQQEGSTAEDTQQKDEQPSVFDQKNKDIQAQSFMKDPDFVYIYETDHAGEIAYVFSHREGDWYYWDIDGFDEDESYSFMEDETGYYEGIGMHAYLEIPKPIEENKRFDIYVEEYSTVIDMDISLKTKAGTFEQVVVVENDNHYKMYYAPKAGIILVTDETDEVVSELIEIVPTDSYK